jgi:hypothetical protein
MHWSEPDFQLVMISGCVGSSSTRMEAGVGWRSARSQTSPDSLTDDLSRPMLDRTLRISVDAARPFRERPCAPLIGMLPWIHGCMLSEEERRLVGLWAGDCAERVLPLFEAKAPSDPRPREAIEGVKAFARGGKRTARLRSLAWAAHAAARAVGDPAATAAARAASLAAATAYMHPLATPHQAKHVLGPAVYAARARELVAYDPGAGDEEIRWAIQRASPAVREVLRRMPVPGRRRSRVQALFGLLDAGLRG